MAPARSIGLDTPQWLAHHHRSERHKCVTIAGRHVCRRCLVLYPLSITVAVLYVTGALGRSIDVWVMWLSPIPLVVDWVLEHLDRVAHSPRRQVVVTALAAWPFGIALGRHAEQPFEPNATIAIVVYGTICLAAWLARTYRSMPDEMPGWEDDFEDAEAEREAKLRALIGLTSDRVSAD